MVGLKRFATFTTLLYLWAEWTKFFKFIVLIFRFGFTPLDDAKRRGNIVAALALIQAGGLESSDARMAKYLADARNARVRWWRNARKKTIAEVVDRSPEAEVWKSANDKALPPLKSLLDRIEHGHCELDKLLKPALQSLLTALMVLADSRVEQCNETAECNTGSSDAGALTCNFHRVSKFVTFAVLLQSAVKKTSLLRAKKKRRL